MTHVLFAEPESGNNVPFLDPDAVPLDYEVSHLMHFTSPLGMSISEKKMCNYKQNI